MYKHILYGFLVCVLFTGCFRSDSDSKKYPVKVLVINFFEIGEDTKDTAGERQLWIERLNLNKKFDFKVGKAPLYYNEDTQVLNLLTKEANIYSAVSTMALGLDSRFDLTKAYILLVGIAGGDPQVTSVGSAVWSRYIIDGDLHYSFDDREKPSNWNNGITSYNTKDPHQKPVVHHGSDFFEINPALYQWAYNLTKDIKIEDDPSIQKKRDLYKEFSAAQKAPTVQIGDNIAASDYWHGKLKTEWAREWVKYKTEGKGTFYTSAMEDTGVMTALTQLAKGGYVDINRVLSLRTVSNYTMQWSGATAYQSFFSDYEGYLGLKVSLESAFLVGNTVVQEILSNWSLYKEGISS